MFITTIVYSTYRYIYIVYSNIYIITYGCHSDKQERWENLFAQLQLLGRFFLAFLPEIDYTDFSAVACFGFWFFWREGEFYENLATFSTQPFHRRFSELKIVCLLYSYTNLLDLK